MSKTTIPTGGITADAIDGTLIADDAINSEHYTDGSIDTAHIGDSQVTAAKTSGVGGGMEFVARTSVSSSTSTVEFTGLNSTGGGSIRVIFNRIITDASGGVNMQFVIGDNSSYRTGSSTYQMAHQYNQIDSSSSGNEQAEQSSFRLCDSIGADTSGNIGGYFDIYGFADSSTNKFVTYGMTHFRAAGGRYTKTGGGFIDTDAAMTKLKLQLSSGNYTAGEFIIYRYKES